MSLMISSGRSLSSTVGRLTGPPLSLRALTGVSTGPVSMSPTVDCARLPGVHDRRRLGPREGLPRRDELVGRIDAAAAGLSAAAIERHREAVDVGRGRGCVGQGHLVAAHCGRWVAVRALGAHGTARERHECPGSCCRPGRRPPPPMVQVPLSVAAVDTGLGVGAAATAVAWDGRAGVAPGLAQPATRAMHAAASKLTMRPIMPSRPTERHRCPGRAPSSGVPSARPRAAPWPGPALGAAHDRSPGIRPTRPGSVPARAGLTARWWSSSSPCACPSCRVLAWARAI